MMPVPSRLVRTAALLTLAVVAPLTVDAQGTSSGFAPGTRTIVDLNFAGTAVGDFPKGLRLLQGNMEVVDKDGVRMLRASSPSEFVLQLPEALPKDFTVEFEIIPKACCNPVDLMLEGVISGSRSSVSAQLEWHPGHFAVVGGNPQMFQMDMPAAIAATLPSALTTVAVSFEDETVKMYTNGKRLYTLADRKFVRGRVLRISLGGQDDDKHAVYLARVRVADAAATIATSQSASTGSGLANSLNGATLSTTGGGAVPVPVSTPTATAVAVPSNPGVTAGPLPAGTVAPTAAQTAATQPTALSSPTNPLPVVSPAPSEQQQNPGLAPPRGSTGATATAPVAAASGPLSTVTAPAASTSKLAGPAAIKATDLSANAASVGWGVLLQWAPVSGAVSYRVSRTVTGSGIAGVAVTVIDLPFAFGAGSYVNALDAGVEPVTDYTYWVEGVQVSGVLTNPSSVVTVRTGMPPTITNLRATVSGTTQVALPGAVSATGLGSGSNVTWAWDALPLAFVYEVSYELIGVVGGARQRKTIYTSVAPTPVVPPVAFGVPQGGSVYFCVSVWGSPVLAKSLPASASCLTTQVP